MRNKISSPLKRGLKIVEDGLLRKVLQSEIRHEISNPRFLGVETGHLGDFKVDWDSPGSKDVVLRRRFDSGEEVVVSALLHQEPSEDADTTFPRRAMAKVCIRKPGLRSIMQFDCRVSETGSRTSDFDIERAYFIRSLVSSRSSPYGEDLFRTLDPKLQDALKQYLTSKGISGGLTNFLLCHLNKKEQDQYVNWLRKLESTVSHSLKPGGDLPDGGYTMVAVVGIKDPVRPGPGVREAVQTCQAAGITVRMVTGDNISTAKAIAKECGIFTEGGLAIEGSQFRDLPPHEMRAIIPKLQVMARSLPLDKHTLVSNLRKIGEEVAVTGDGTNDAPALHEADIGLAMGIAGTEVAKENADVIIMDDNFKIILNVARWGRACITGSAPLTAVQMLWVNMIMDTLGALALATEPPNEGLMKRPPIARTASFITKTMWRNIAGQSVYQLIVLGNSQFRRQISSISMARIQQPF